jgi:hypothetical protein
MTNLHDFKVLEGFFLTNFIFTLLYKIFNIIVQNNFFNVFLKFKNLKNEFTTNLQLFNIFLQYPLIISAKLPQLDLNYLNNSPKRHPRNPTGTQFHPTRRFMACLLALSNPRPFSHIRLILL